VPAKASMSELCMIVKLQILTERHSGGIPLIVKQIVANKKDSSGMTLQLFL
jgi:hypothetical protein